MYTNALTRILVLFAAVGLLTFSGAAQDPEKDKDKNQKKGGFRPQWVCVEYEQTDNGDGTSYYFGKDSPNCRGVGFVAQSKLPKGDCATPAPPGCVQIETFLRHSHVSQDLQQAGLTKKFDPTFSPLLKNQSRILTSYVVKLGVTQKTEVVVKLFLVEATKTKPPYVSGYGLEVEPAGAKLDDTIPYNPKLTPQIIVINGKVCRLLNYGGIDYPILLDTQVR